jgi:hypothetical protein
MLNPIHLLYLHTLVAFLVRCKCRIYPARISALTRANFANAVADIRLQNKNEAARGKEIVR